MLEPSEVASILDEVARGNRNAFARIVHAYSLPLRSYLASYLHSLDEVDDLAQEVFLAAFGNVHAFLRGESFSAWLRGVARHKVLEHFRRTARRNRALAAFREEVTRVVEADLERAVAADRSEVIEALLRCIAQLPEKLRRIVRGGLDGDKPASLAAALDTSVGCIYNLHYRANQLLRVCLEKERS